MDDRIRENKKRWCASEKGKAYERERSAKRRTDPAYVASLKRYGQTARAKEMARERDKRYRESEKGKAVRVAWHTQKRETDGPEYYRRIKGKYAVSDQGRTVARDKQRRRRSRCVSTPVELYAIAAWEVKWRRRRSVRCYWCRGSFSPSQCHTDHIHALAGGGLHAIDNLCISCASCNWKKNDKPLDVWNRSLIQMVLL
jgi:hypothetical protein